jgi:hypothetical protein
MGFSFDNVKRVSRSIPDLAAAKKVHLMRADQRLTVKRVNFVACTAGTATAATWSLENWGTAGTAIKAGAAGTVVAPIAGTALQAAIPLAPTVAQPDVASGEWLVVNYAKAAGDTYPEKLVVVEVEYVDGVGA